MTEGTDMNQIETVARAIIGPHEPVPASSRYTLDELREVRWRQITSDERSMALREAKAAIAAMPVQAEPQWQGIEIAPDMDRVIVAGWEPRSGNVRGYWWYGEDVVINGRATMRPRATLWRPFNNPAFPTPPAGGSDGTES